MSGPGFENGPGQEAPPILSERDATPANRWRWWVHLLLLAGYVLALGWLGAERAPTRAPALTHSAKGLLITCVLQLALFGAVFALAWVASRASRQELLLRWRGGLWVLPLGIAYSIALRLIVAIAALIIVATLLLARVLTTDQVQQFARTNSPDVATLVDVQALKRDPLYFWLTLTFVSFVVAGLREELWRSGMLAGMRALWPRVFGSTAGQLGAVGIAAIVFGIGHLALGPLGVAAATLLGLGLGVIMVLHRSIWPAVIAHGMFDATTFGLLPWVMELMHRAQ